MIELDDILNELSGDVYVLVADLTNPNRIEIMTPRTTLEQLYAYTEQQRTDMAQKKDIRHYYIAHYKRPNIGYYIKSAANNTFTLLDTPVYIAHGDNPMEVPKGCIA